MLIVACCPTSPTTSSTTSPEMMKKQVQILYPVTVLHLGEDGEEGSSVDFTKYCLVRAW